jgi:signal transduction histidine kinase
VTARGVAHPPPGSARHLADAGLAAGMVAVVTLVLYPLTELDPGVSSGVLYVLGVLLLATYRGLWLGIAASIASALALDYFHAEPAGTFHARNAGDLAAIAVMLATAVVASVIADRARQRADEAERRLALEDELRSREVERIRQREVRASHARVIEAADQERRRVVRDLHDGAQQRLVNTVLTLSLARSLLERDLTGARVLVDEALEHARRATTELRELAHGILPAALTHGGLRAGVDALAERTPLPVETDMPPGRLPANVEATAYFVVAEALTNVAKHAAARHAWVRGTASDGHLRVEVRDDGVGGARCDGTGLVGIQDRLAVLDGELEVHSPPGGGTVIAATIPVQN